MIFHQFPDLQWLKQQIAQRFRNQKGFNGLPLETDGFPSVVIHAKATETYRPDVTGPISVFMNLKGVSRCTVEGRTVAIPEDYFFLSNRFQPYTLEIESEQPVETFNIHMGEYFSEGVLSALLTPADTILNNGLQQNVQTVAFYNRLYPKDAVFRQYVQLLQLSKGETYFNKLLFEESLAGLLVHLLKQHRHIVAEIEKMPPVKRGTRVELYKRLSHALDYIHAHEAGVIDLEALAGAACLSKYHFLRLFRQTYGLSPYQYVQQLRLEKARKLLKVSSLPIADIAYMLGFENSNSFSRLFYQKTGVYPSLYRSGEQEPGISPHMSE